MIAIVRIRLYLENVIGHKYSVERETYRYLPQPDYTVLGRCDPQLPTHPSRPSLQTHAVANTVAMIFSRPTSTLAESVTPLKKMLLEEDEGSRCERLGTRQLYTK